MKLWVTLEGREAEVTFRTEGGRVVLEADRRRIEADFVRLPDGEVYSLLITIDFPDAMTGGLRRTTDALRAVLERTRGDLTTSLLQTRLLEGIEGRAGQPPTGG